MLRGRAASLTRALGMKIHETCCEGDARLTECQ